MAVLALADKSAAERVAKSKRETQLGDLRRIVHVRTGRLVARQPQGVAGDVIIVIGMLAMKTDVRGVFLRRIIIDVDHFGAVGREVGEVPDALTAGVGGRKIRQFVRQKTVCCLWDVPFRRQRLGTQMRREQAPQAQDIKKSTCLHVQ